MKHKKINTEEHSLEKKLKLLKKVSLSDEERHRMSSFLSEYAQMHPVMGKQERVLREKREHYFQITSFFRSAMPALAVGVFFVFGGIALAESSLPGNPLYGLKTTGEVVRQSFIFNQEQRARYEAERIARRLKEAQRLIENGAVTEEVTERFAHELRDNLLSFRESLNKLNAEDKHMIAFGIEKASSTRIGVYKDIFAKMAEREPEISTFLGEIALRFDLPSDYFESKELSAAATMSDSLGEEGVLFTLGSVPAEEVATQYQPEVNGDLELRTMMVGSNGPVYAESWLSTDGLKLYASVRITETERLINRARPRDVRIKEALEDRLNDARMLYDGGVSAEEAGNETDSHFYFLESLDKTECLRVLAGMSSGKLSDFLTEFILNHLKEKHEKPVIPDSEIAPDLFEEVHGSRESPEFPRDTEEEIEKNENNGETEGESSLETEGVSTPNMEEVRKILDGIRL